MNVCDWIMRTNTFAEYVENGCKAKYPVSVDEANMEEVFSTGELAPETTYEIKGGKPKKKALFTFTVSSDADVLAQNVITVKFDWEKVTLSIPGTKGKDIEIKRLVWVNDAPVHTLTVSHNELIKVKKVTAKQN